MTPEEWEKFKNLISNGEAEAVMYDSESGNTFSCDGSPCWYYRNGCLMAAGSSSAQEYVRSQIEYVEENTFYKPEEKMFLQRFYYKVLANGEVDVDTAILIYARYLSMTITEEPNKFLLDGDTEMDPDEFISSAIEQADDLAKDQGMTLQKFLHWIKNRED